MATIPRKTKKKAIRNGIIHKMEVFQHGTILGYGYVVSFDDGQILEPDLFNFKGEKLEIGWYELRMIEYRVCVIPRNIQ